MNNNRNSEIIYILIRKDAKGITFFKKEEKNYAEVPTGTRVTATDGGWLLETTDGKSATLEGRPVILIQ